MQLEGNEHENRHYMQNSTFRFGKLVLHSGVGVQVEVKGNSVSPQRFVFCLVDSLDINQTLGKHHLILLSQLLSSIVYLNC